MLVKNLTCRDFDLWKQLYISLVRPHLEFASSVLNPYRQGDISILEKVQRLASKIPIRIRIYYMRKGLRYGVLHHRRNEGQEES